MQRAEAERGIELEPDQRRAIATALSRQVSIISGGPGTGKTTTTQVLVDLLEQRGLPYLLLSPTGKAAKRLAEATAREAHTIHRQLYALQREKRLVDGAASPPAASASAGTAPMARVQLREVPLPRASTAQAASARASGESTDSWDT
jgi:ATP-dependent exoDNAse (exonuclease V) alpha subunit